MLTLIASTPRRNALPLQYAQSFSFSTGEDGDEAGTIELDASVATLADYFQIGDSCAVWCNRTHRVVWRGSLEVIERAPDGALQLGLIGFGALQREATASVVVNAFRVDHWKTLETGQLSGSYSSVPADWSIEYLNTSNTIRVATARTGTYNNASQVAFVIVFQNEEHYKTITTDEQIKVGISTATGLFNSAGNGLRVSRIDSTNVPFSPVSYSLLLTSSMSATYTAPSHTTRGWIVITACNGTETTAGASSAQIDMLVNGEIQVSSARIADALAVNGGFCTYVTPVLYHGGSELVKTDATARDMFAMLYYDSAKTQPVRYNQKRFVRHRDRVAYNFRGNRQTWRVYDVVAARNISRKASVVYAQYNKWYGSWSTVRSTTDKAVRNVSSRRKLNERTVNAGMTFSANANVLRDSVARDIEQTPTELTIELSNDNDALATRGGAMVPNWSADVEDDMLIPTYFRPLQIVARTITRDSVTYDLAATDNTLEQFVRAR